MPTQHAFPTFPSTLKQWPDLIDGESHVGQMVPLLPQAGEQSTQALSICYAGVGPKCLVALEDWNHSREEVSQYICFFIPPISLMFGENLVCSQT